MIVPYYFVHMGRMTETKWLIGGCCICDEWKALDRGEMLSLRKAKRGPRLCQDRQRLDTETGR